MPQFLRVRSTKFPILDGEKEEIVNPGTYGKAFAQYLQRELTKLGYDSPSICCEDWGWWVDVKLTDVSIGLCCYRHHERNTECDFVCSPSPESDRVWSWRRFRKIDIGDDLRKLTSDLEHVFTHDPEIEFVGRSSEFPF